MISDFFHKKMNKYNYKVSMVARTEITAGNSIKSREKYNVYSLVHTVGSDTPIFGGLFERLKLILSSSKI